uniref:Uncharacterized protein n=1 Tax=Plectus sambesii TaxID=2011161 RepID=A0A914V7X5_9BILA
MLKSHCLPLILFLFLLPRVAAALPDVDRCCRSKGVSDLCARTMCDPSRPPNDFEVYDIFEQRYSCATHLPAIASCLADGRDHTTCCKADAKDLDEDACFGFCKGDAPVLNTSQWESTKPYQTCLSVNIDSIYRCFNDGYKKSPGPPRRLRVNGAGIDSVDFDWSPPTEAAAEVSSYTLVCFEVSSPDDRSSATRVETRSTRATISGLRPDTKYSAYVVANSRDGVRKSLPSEAAYFVTKGVAPKLGSYQEVVNAPIGAAMTTIACRVQVPGDAHTRLHIEWARRDNDGNFRLLDSSQKYGLVAYVSRHAQPRDYVSTLLIRNVVDADYGLYRCVATNDFGAGSAEIRVVRPAAQRIPAAPPNATACCEQLGVKKRCMASCGPDAPDRKRGVKPDAMLPTRHCFDDYLKVVQCSLEGVDQGACCLRRKVPTHCLSMCDGSTPALAQDAAASCVVYATDIFSCRIETAHQLPEAVNNVRIVRRSTDSATVRWDSAPRADVYHVYFRRKASTGSWERTMVAGTETRLSGLRGRLDYTVVVVSSNSYGRSGASRAVDIDDVDRTQTVQRYDPPNHAAGLLEEGVADS